VKIRAYQPRAGRKVFVGILAVADAQGIEVEEESTHVREKFAFGEIQAANYEHIFD
jgi:ribosome maturation factor RimP